MKLHLLLDHDGYLPSFAVLTEGKTHEIRVARELRFAPAPSSFMIAPIPTTTALNLSPIRASGL